MTRRRLCSKTTLMAQRGQKRAADDDGEAAFLADLDGLFEPDEPTALVEAKKQKGRPLGSVSGPTSRPTHFLKACVDAKAGKAWLMELPYKYRQIGNNKTRAVLRCTAHQTSEGGPRVAPRPARARAARMTPNPPGARMRSTRSTTAARRRSGPSTRAPSPGTRSTRCRCAAPTNRASRTCICAPSS